jgi:hypothetical protein
MISRTTLDATLACSRFRAWMMIAPTIMATTPSAASGVSTGATPYRGRHGQPNGSSDLSCPEQSDRGGRDTVEPVAEGGTKPFT